MVLATLTAVVFADAAGASAGRLASSASFVHNRTELFDEMANDWPAQDVRTRGTSLTGNPYGYDDRSHLTSAPARPGEHRLTPSATSDVLLNSSKQLQSKFKHAADFGVTGNYSKANAAKFSAALNQHINSSSVSRIAGTYRGNPVTHYLDRSTGVNVIVDPSGAFVSGWKLGPEQLMNVLKHGGLS